MAFIKKAIRKQNIGLIVTCKEMIGYLFQYEEFTYNGEVWVSAATDYTWAIESPTSSIDTLYGKSKIAFSPDSWLSPIKADGLDMDKERDLELEDDMAV